MRCPNEVLSTVLRPLLLEDVAQDALTELPVENDRYGVHAGSHSSVSDRGLFPGVSILSAYVTLNARALCAFRGSFNGTKNDSG